MILHISSIFLGAGKISQCLVTEPLGRDLSHIIKSNPRHSFPISLVKKLAKDILSALETLQNYHVVHSDIKPENIATTISQKLLFNEVQKMVDPKAYVWQYRMNCQTYDRTSRLSETAAKKILKGCLEKCDVTKLPEQLFSFKLIDLGNVMVRKRINISEK